MRALCFCALTLALTSGACGDAAGVTTGPTPVTLSTSVFSGRLEVGAARFYSFTSEGGTISVTLASVTSPQTGMAVDTPLSLGLGVPRGTGCDASPRMEATAALFPQLSRALTAGVYCIEISDNGGLSGAVNFAVRFQYP